MAAKVRATLGEMAVTREEGGPVFAVDLDGEVFGELRVSKGGVRWRAKHQKVDADWHHATWKQFDKLMRKQPRK